MLDELILPGAPHAEAERRKLWLKIPRRSRAVIRKVHRKCDRKPKSMLKNILDGTSTQDSDRCSG